MSKGQFHHKLVLILVTYDTNFNAVVVFGLKAV